MREQRARDVGADLAAAGDDRVHQPARSPTGGGAAGADGLGQGRDRRLGRADGAEARAWRRTSARRGSRTRDDDAPEAVAPLHDLADHDVRVVAVRRDDGGVRVGDPRPLEDLGVHPVPDDEAAAPVAEPRRARPRPRRRTSRPSPRPRAASRRDDPTRPHPTITDLHAASEVSSVEDAFGEGDDEHLARRVLEHVVDRRREEPRLPPPARRRAEHDQVDLAPRRLLDDRVPDRARAHAPRRRPRRRSPRRAPAPPRARPPRARRRRRAAARRAPARAAPGRR